MFAVQFVFVFLFLQFFYITDAVPTQSWRCGGLARNGWPLFADERADRCYQVIDSEMHWEEAQIHCNNMAGPNGQSGQGKLATFDSPNGLAEVRQWLRNVKWHRNGVWIGARRCDMSTNGFCWVDQSPVPSSIMTDFWGPGEPSRRVAIIFEANCVQLRQASNWRGYTYPCHATKFHYSFICQFPMLPMTTTSTTTTTTTAPPTTTTTTTTTTSTTTTVPEIANLVIVDESTTSVTVDPVVMARGVVTSATVSKSDSGVNMLLVGLFSGFGAALIILIIVALFVWRRCRTQQSPPTVVVFTPVAGTSKKGAEEEEIVHNQQVEMAIHMKQHPTLSMAGLTAALSAEGPPPRSPPPAYRAFAGPGETCNPSAALIRTGDIANRSIVVMANECQESSQDNVYAVLPGAL